MTTIDRLKRLNLILGALAVLLVALLVLRPSERTVVREAEHPPLFPDLKVEDVRTIALKQVPTSGMAQATAPKEIRVAREGDFGWRLPDRFGYPAAPEKVISFLESLQQAKSKGVVTRRLDTFDEYAGDEGWIEVEIQGAGGLQLATFAMGKAAGWPESYVRIDAEGGGQVHKAWNLTPDKVRVDFDAWGEGLLWPGLTLPQVQKIDVYQRDEKGTLVFQRTEQAVPGEDGESATTETVWRMLAPQEADAERSPVETLVRSITGMRFSDVVAADAGTEDRFGLAPAAYRVVLHGKPPAEGEAAPRYVLEIGRGVPAEGAAADASPDTSPDAYFVRRGKEGWVFTVGSFSLSDVKEPASRYLPAPVEPAPSDDEGAAEDDGAAEGEGAGESERATGSPDDGDAPEGDLPPLPPEVPDDADGD